jgi:CBS domain-containing protein
MNELTRNQTARDLMSVELVTIDASMPLREAAAMLAKRKIHGAPVVDEQGRCVGVFSVTDLARWVSGVDQTNIPAPRTCSFQGKCREPGGHEITTCQLPEGVCPLQRVREMSDGSQVLACIDPNSVPTDWQMVELETLPGEAVRDYMTTVVVAAPVEATIPELARAMLDQHVHRLFVLDAQRHPVGVVTVTDLLRVIADRDTPPAA